MFSVLRSVAAGACVETALFGEVCDDCHGGGFWSILAPALEILIYSIGALAVAALVWAGILYMTAAGDSGQMTKARRRIHETLIGLAVYGVGFALISWLTPGGVRMSKSATEYSCPTPKPVELMTPSDKKKAEAAAKQAAGTATSEATAGETVVPSSEVIVGQVATQTSKDAGFDQTTIARAEMGLPSGADFLDNHKCSDKVVYPGKTYELTTAQANKLAAMIYYENCQNIIACKATASHMANLYEAKTRGGAKDAAGKTLYEWATTTQWYATRTSQVDPSRATANAKKAVQEVIVEGNRTLPAKVTNFDCGPWTDCPDTTYFVIQGKKVPPTAENIKALNPGNSKIGAKWGNQSTFWCVVTQGSGYGDIFKY